MLGFRRLPIHEMPNLRDLGGYAVPDGMTKYGVFLRSAVPNQLTDEGKALLRRYSLGTVIDFRSAQETERIPDPLREMDGVDYIHLPIFDAAAAGAALKIRPGTGFSWTTHYIRMVDEQYAWVVQVIRTLAHAKGCALFHCTTGKDRAGIISALILALCGVSEEDIIADYCVSEVYLRNMYAGMENYAKLCNGDLDNPFYRTKPAAMRALLKYLEEVYDGAGGYLEKSGLSKKDAALIRTKLIGEF
ncbi:MAG: tyrosine-protein phosphatase [Oscillospiraceae bacterium]